MEITGLRCELVSGTTDQTHAEFFEDWLSEPVDIYGGTEPDTGGQDVEADEDAPLAFEQLFVTVETSTGERGFAGPIYGGRPRVPLVRELEPVLVGEDPLATERCWDRLYRSQPHGRTGKTMQAISAVDCALWDLKGRHFDEPVHRLLGGPTRERLPCYVSTLGHSVDPDAAAETAAGYADRGVAAQKWFFRNGPAAGRAGERENEALVAAIREAVGEEYDLMFDAWMSWDLPYARRMVDRTAEYGPRWLEEPLFPDKLDAYATLNREAPFAITGGEHAYTRWGANELLRRGAVDVLQTDVIWGGGITEIGKIAALASVHDVPLVPHGFSTPVNRHVAAALSPEVCPMIEYLATTPSSYFIGGVEPVDGRLPVPEGPGLGIELDESLIDQRVVVED